MGQSLHPARLHITTVWMHVLLAARVAVGLERLSEEERLSPAPYPFGWASRRGRVTAVAGWPHRPSHGASVPLPLQSGRGGVAALRGPGRVSRPCSPGPISSLPSVPV